MEKFIANEYKSSYREKVRAKQGIVTKNAKFVFPRRHTGDTLAVPFTIEYEVMGGK